MQSALDEIAAGNIANAAVNIDHAYLFEKALIARGLQPTDTLPSVEDLVDAYNNAA